MCGPAALPIAAAVVAIGGKIFSGLQAAGQARYQAKIAERNAGLAREQGQDARATGLIEDRDTQRRTAQALGAQRAAMAANGIDADFGSAAQAAGDTRMIGQEDVDRLRRNTANAMRGFDMNAANYAAEASAQRSKATGALVDTAFDVASTALGAAQQNGWLTPSLKKKSSPTPARSLGGNDPAAFDFRFG